MTPSDSSKTPPSGGPTAGVSRGPFSGSPLFQSFFIGGFECSSHRLRSGPRLDMIAATGHDRHAAADYRRLRERGILTARDGLRWHLIEKSPGRFDFSSLVPMVRAARAAGVEVIWDLLHYGYPDDLDPLKPQFVTRFARFARAAALVLADEGEAAPFLSPVNEISFFSWGGGDVAYLNPFHRGRGHELKTQLVRAAIEAIEAAWSVSPKARIVHVDPLINIVADPARPKDRRAAENHRMGQFQAWDMIAGRQWPGLGGQEKYLDIVGVNYYSNNQWVHGGRTLAVGERGYRPFRHLLAEVHAFYGRPMLVSETGVEDEARPGWLRYVAREARAAIAMGVPLHGVCLYPVVNHPGWDDDRHCHNGLWDYPDKVGQREVYAPLARELARQVRRAPGGRVRPAPEPLPELEPA